MGATFAATLVDEWVRGGVTDAVVAPGSRSTPLVLALAARAEIRLHVRLDERSAAFYALGLATGRPPVVAVTSGTAAAELHPAVVEAHHAGVPLLVCTADRPPELQGVGAPQTVDQVGLFGPAVRWAAAPGPAEEATRGTWRSLGARALAECRDGPAGPGPVHLNLAFREPLVGPPGPLPPARPGTFHAVERSAVELAAPPEVVGGWAGRRGIVVAGAGAGPAADVLALADRLGWPVLADPRSGLRRAVPGVVGAADALLRQPEVAAALRPEAVLLLGERWVSGALASHLAGAAAAGAEVVALDPAGRWRDPDRLAYRVEAAPAGPWLRAAARHRALTGPGTDDGRWRETWATAEAAAQAAFDAHLGEAPLSEPGVARVVFDLVGEPGVVLAGSSMPVRDLEWFARPSARPPTVLANRGANGIDGLTSTARGLAAGTDARVVALVGDLAFLHDVSALVAGPAGAGSCTVVVLDNRGGGIFSFLPQAAALDHDRFEALFGTPPAVDVSAVARGFGVPVTEARTVGDLAAGLAAGRGRSLSVVRVAVPDRETNVALHDRLNRVAGRAAAAALGLA